ncbi:MAG: hypothetical protein R6V85_10825 [Polyangia bacterium]
MKRSLPVVGAAVGLGAGVLLLALSQPGCEEVLEVCAPCGLVSEGVVDISGDPRMDSAFEAVYRLGSEALEAAEAFDRGMAELAAQVGATAPEDGEFDAADVAQIVAAIRAELDEPDGIDLRVEIERGGCWVDSELALERQLICEEAAGCYVSPECAGEIAGSCTGLCAGDCGASCDGDCYRSVESGDALGCLLDCVGSCAGMVAGLCPGRCVGLCEGTCSAHDSDGDCNGRCRGDCTGVCELGTPFSCPGTCAGLCRIPHQYGEPCPICRGDCTDGSCGGSCRGQFRPAGCDMPTRCEGVYECQEASRWLAWAYLRCDPGRARVAVEMGAQYTGDRARAVGTARLLERIATDTLSGHAWASLLVDGIDVTGELASPGGIEEDLAAGAQERPELAGLEYLNDPVTLCELGVDAERRQLPLSGLKAHLGHLAGGVDAGDFTIPAGAMPCVQPALEDAVELLGKLVPTSGGGDCSNITGGGGTSGGPEADRSAGLYRLLDAQSALLDGLAGDGGVDGGG